jgi:hypothetical protein
MAYQINKTDGTIVATVADGQIDDRSTAITLIGKNYSGFGEIFNENLIQLLENFADSTPPDNPIRGQIWFDSSQSKLKVYNGLDFVPVSSATISGSQPSTLATGDLWYDNVRQQLFFFDGTAAVLLAPSYSSSQSLSGIRVDTILDTLNQTRVITSLYNNGILLGIFAKDSFTPKVAIIGFTGSIEPGFNAGTLANFKIRATCTNSDSLGGAVSTTYVRTDSSNAINGQLQITVDSGLIVGSAGQGLLFVNGGDLVLANSSSDKNITLSVNKAATQENAVVINAAARTIGLYPTIPSSTVNVGGNLVITGDLTVEGTTTTLNTSIFTVEDKNVVIANVASPSNSTADGAGITIKGTTDKTIAYSESSNWLAISDTVNLAAGKALYIGGTKVIDGNSLGSAITSIPGVSSFGTQTVVNIGPGAPAVTQLRLENHRISTVSSNFDIELEPDGTGNVVLIGSPRITGMANPTSAQDAATKEYTDNRIESRPLIFSIDISDGKSNTYIIANILNNLSPVAEYRTGTYARILCSLISNNSQTLEINSLPPALSTAAFLTNLGGASSLAITNISFPTATIAASSVSVTRIIKLFQIVGGVWAWQSDTVLPP